MGTRLLAVLFALAGLLQVAALLKIAAFNIQSFGVTKMSNTTLSSYIVQVSPRWANPKERPQRERIMGPRNAGQPCGATGCMWGIKSFWFQASTIVGGH